MRGYVYVGRISGLDSQPPPVGISLRFGAALQVQALEDFFHVPFGGALADVKPLCNPDK